MKKNKKGIPCYPDGGQFKDFMGNYGKAGVDSSLSLLGLTNVIPDSAYKGNSAKGFTNFTGAMGKVGQIATPLALQAAGVPAPVTMAGMQGLSMMNPQAPVQELPQTNIPMQNQYNPLDPYQVATGGYRFPHGGQIGVPNVELELQENTLNPDGSTHQFDGPSHQQGGIPAKLDPTTLVFSDRLKKNGKTYAELNKPNMTKKEDKILDNNKSNRLQKLTAELMKEAKNKKSLALFQEQEQMKAAKMAKYASRIGYTPTGSSQVKLSNKQVLDMADNFDLANFDKLSKYDQERVAKAMTYPYGGQIPKAWGGLQVPYTAHNKNDLPIMLNPYAAAYANNSIAMKGMTPSIDNESQPLDLSSNLATQGLGTPMQTTGKTGNFPVNWSATDTTPQVDIQGKGFDWGSLPWDQIGQGAMQVGLGLAANAGNLQALKYSKDYDKQSFERVSPDYLDPSAAIRENSQNFRNASEQIKDASMGNSATYIQNRRALANDRMMRDNAIRKEFGNINANISNNAKMFNANQQVNESNANLANKARMQDMRTKAIGDIGHNIYSQGSNLIKDKRMADTQKQYLSVIASKYPEILKDPELRKIFGL